MESSRRALAFGSVKTRFKAIFEKLDFSAKICFFHELLPPGGRLSYEAYNVFNILYLRLHYIYITLYLHYIYIYITFTFIHYIYIYITFTFTL